jgi:hypothetical protein
VLTPFVRENMLYFYVLKRKDKENPVSIYVYSISDTSYSTQHPPDRTAGM